ncbi:MAG: endonuclease III [Lentisphaeria bacterium]|nr:endonuclease III [Lentisphaeria bacterium]
MAVKSAKERRLAEHLRLIHDRLYGVYGDCTCPLEHADAFQLLVAVTLSAQCRDERVNQVTRILFSAAPDARSMAEMPVERIEEIVQPCGLHKAKSRNIKAAAEMIRSRFGGAVPRTMEELTSLPGIGRKSANVILGNVFGVPGFPVDTHVRRLMNRLGAVATQDPEKIEAVVNALVPPELWTNFSHLLITHGRRVCHAGRPECAKCVLNDLCPEKGIR